MAPLSPQITGSTMPASPRSSSGSQRPSILKRNSSQGIMRTTIRSPSSELDIQPLRHAVRPKGHARVVLPRNHSSGRNLAKLARQAAAGEAGVNKVHTRTRSHEGDTEIRLPGSLEEAEARPPPMRRNLTSSHLPRNTSHTKLKKNLSHGHLVKLGTARDMAPLTSSKKAPLSPGLKGRSKRPKSLDWGLEKDLHEQEVEILQQQQDLKQNGQKKVGFRVGSAGEDEDDEQVPNMEGSGLDEGEWTEESASVSPYSTRVNTANNSRRASIQQDRPPDKSSLSKVSHAFAPDVESTKEEPESDSTAADDADTGRNESTGSTTTEAARPDVVSETLQHAVAAAPPAITRSPLHAAKEHPNPTTQLLLRRNSNQLPAPALVSNVTAVDEVRSMKASPAGSLLSGNATMGADPENEELVSRFVPSTSNGSGTTTNMQNTPKSSSFHTPTHGESDKHGFGVGPVSPGSTISGSSGAATPAMGRSRIELRMLQEKALAEVEKAAERGLGVPAHVYDRRNETLKSYLQLAALNQAGNMAALNTPISLGPEMFQGRFKAVNTELKVVQKFRNPIAESFSRLQSARGGKSSLRGAQKTNAGLRTSKSAVTLPIRGAPKRDGNNLSTSTSPPKVAGTMSAGPTAATDVTGDMIASPATSKPALTAAKSSMAIKPVRRTASRGVSFAGMDARVEAANESAKQTLDDVVQDMWDSVLT